MLSYTIRRILIIFAMLLVASFLVYAGLELMPGDTVSFIADPETLANMDSQKLDALREELGLNDPFIVRYFNWLGGVVKGDFGYSLASGVPIRTIVFDTLPATIELSLAALCFSAIIGTIFGIISALNKGRVADNTLTVAGLLGMSIPRFFLGIVSLLLFAINLEWLPVGGRVDPGAVTLTDRLSHLVLPAVVLGIALTAGVMRYARSSMLDVANKEFMRTARSKGLPEWRINLVHGFRVAMTPVVVLIGLRLPMLIGGTVVIEQVFQWPGIGNAFLGAVRGQNYPLVMMIALFMVFATMISSLLIDILTAWLDPRVRLH
jgi:peptide/nickel transport system permease protein